jgi:hypothetical protein
MTELKTTGLEVVSASYGVAPNFQDVTAEVQKLVQDGDLSFTVGAQSLGILDPAPGVIKTFQAKVVINGGKPTILSKDDGELFAVSAPPIKPDAKKSSHFWNIYSSIGYGISAIIAAYLAMSAYQFGKMSFNTGGDSNFFMIVGIIFGGITLLTYGYFGIIAIPIIVFLYSLYNPTGINFNYPIKKV